MKVRETGRIALGKDGGGSLKFLGRVISRRAGSPSLVMQVDPSYMDAACEEFGIKVPKGVVGPPDIKPNLEATSEESPISPEAHSRYQRAWSTCVVGTDPHGPSALYLIAGIWPSRAKAGAREGIASSVEVCCHRQSCGATFPN